MTGIVAVSGFLVGTRWSDRLKDLPPPPLIFTGFIMMVAVSWIVLSGDRPVKRVLPALKRSGRAQGAVKEQNLEERSSDSLSTVRRWRMRVNYEVGGETREVAWYPYDVWTDSDGFIRRAGEKYAVGTPVTVRYDPNDKENAGIGSTRVRGEHVILALIDLAATAIFLGGAFLMTLMLAAQH